MERTLREATNIHPDLWEVAEEIQTWPSSPQTEKQIDDLQRQWEQRWELAELIKRKDDETKTAESVPPELYRDLQTPVPFQASDTQLTGRAYRVRQQRNRGQVDIRVSDIL